MFGLEIEQRNNGEFVLRNGPRSIPLKYDDVTWICEDGLDDFNMTLAKSFYNIS